MLLPMILLHLLLTCATAVPPQDPPLVLVPEGWRHERIDFPLSFAPELEFRGFEDLSFAPGMFELNSSTYFSYALGLRLEGDVELGEAQLVHFLEGYYGGLYRAVAEGRKLPLEDRPTHASVRRDGANFKASVRTFDAFTDGRELALELEFSVHCTPRTTEVLGLASPKSADAPIWKELHAIGAAWHAARPAPVFLNHVYAVVDRETYDAIAHSGFLRETFAVSEERATKRADASYSGLYFYGTRTYFELLPPEAAAGFVEGDCGIGLGLEGFGALDLFAKRLAADGMETQGGPITRELGGEMMPWFRIVGVSMPPSPLSVFAMEYNEQFLKRWHADLAPADGGISRADVLARYAASLKRSELHAAAPFADVQQVELRVSDAQRERLTALCKKAQHEIQDEKDARVIRGPQFRLVLKPSDKPGGVTAIELALRHPVEHEPLQLGRARLTFSGKTATMILGQ